MKFEAGQEIFWEGQIYEICLIKARQVILHHLYTGVLQPPVDQTTLEKAYVERTLLPHQAQEQEQPMKGLLFSDLSEFQKRTIINRMHFVNRFLVGDVNIHNAKKVVEEVANDIDYVKPISVGTVRRWLGIYRENNEDPKSLVDHRHPLVRES